MGASAAAVIVRRAERHVVEYLRAQHATDADRAVPFSAPSFVEQRRLQRLLVAQVVRESVGGYWLDEAMYAGYRSDRRALVLVVVAIVTTTAIGMFIVSALT